MVASCWRHSSRLRPYRARDDRALAKPTGGCIDGTGQSRAQMDFGTSWHRWIASDSRVVALGGPALRAARVVPEPGWPCAEDALSCRRETVSDRVVPRKNPRGTPRPLARRDSPAARAGAPWWLFAVQPERDMPPKVLILLALPTEVRVALQRRWWGCRNVCRTLVV